MNKVLIHKHWTLTNTAIKRNRWSGTMQQSVIAVHCSPCLLYLPLPSLVSSPSAVSSPPVSLHFFLFLFSFLRAFLSLPASSPFLPSPCLPLRFPISLTFSPRPYPTLFSLNVPPVSFRCPFLTFFSPLIPFIPAVSFFFSFCPSFPSLSLPSLLLHFPCRLSLIPIPSLISLFIHSSSNLLPIRFPSGQSEYMACCQYSSS